MAGKKNICLSWDATTGEGCHVCEVHLTVHRNSCLVLDVRHLPGGKISDYVEHIVSALTEATVVFSIQVTVCNFSECFNVRTLLLIITCGLAVRRKILSLGRGY